MSENNLKKLSGLWLKEGKKGKFMSGSLDPDAIEWLSNNAPVSLMIFKNTYKQDGDKKPDYELYAAPKEEGGGRRQADPKEGQARDEPW